MAGVTVVVWLLSVALVVSAARQQGLVRKLQRALASAGFACLGMLLGSALLLTHLFHVFSGQTRIARVTTRRLAPAEFELTYLAAGAAASPRSFRLQGDQWAISGGIVKWHPWLLAVGLKGYHKPIAVSGLFSDLARQRSHPPTVFPLEPAGDRVWELFYWCAPYLPFVDAVYGSSAYVYVEPGVVHEVYVTPSGYVIKRASKRPKF